MPRTILLSTPPRSNIVKTFQLTPRSRQFLPHKRHTQYRKQSPTPQCAAAADDNSRTNNDETKLQTDEEHLQAELEVAEKCLVIAIAAQDYAGAAAARDTIRHLQLKIRIQQVQAREGGPKTSSTSGGSGGSTTDGNNVHYYRVGATILHRRYAYHGLIVGRDPTCRAPEEWIQRMMVDRLPHGRLQPFYHILADERDRPGSQMTYVAHENIALHRQQPFQIQHAWLERFMKVIKTEDGVEYFPQAWLRAKYVDDF